MKINLSSSCLWFGLWWGIVFCVEMSRKESENSSFQEQQNKTKIAGDHAPWAEATKRSTQSPLSLLRCNWSVLFGGAETRWRQSSDQMRVAAIALRRTLLLSHQEICLLYSADTLSKLNDFEWARRRLWSVDHFSSEFMSSHNWNLSCLFIEPHWMTHLILVISVKCESMREQIGSIQRFDME